MYYNYYYYYCLASIILWIKKKKKFSVNQHVRDTKSMKKRKKSDTLCKGSTRSLFLFSLELPIRLRIC